jgi:serine/threonine protein phosphatase PrpC
MFQRDHIFRPFSRQGLRNADDGKRFDGLPVPERRVSIRSSRAESMKLRGFGDTDVGQVRECNEDRFVVDPQLGLLLVCDGMGGHAAGEVAAEIAVHRVHAYLVERAHALREISSEPQAIQLAVGLVRAAVQQASNAVHTLASECARYRGMGTTLTLLLVVGKKAVVAHVGDSRLYRQRCGEVWQVTFDHTVENELERRGLPLADDMRDSRFARMLTRSVGEGSTVDVEINVLDLLPGDQFLMCSDGLSNCFEEDLEVGRMLGSLDPAYTVHRLIELANSRGGYDNITAVVARVEREKADCPEADPRRMMGQFDIIRDTPLQGFGI